MRSDAAESSDCSTYFDYCQPWRKTWVESRDALSSSEACSVSSTASGVAPEMRNHSSVCRSLLHYCLPVGSSDQPLELANRIAQILIF